MNKKYFFLAAVFILCIISFFGEWIPAQNISFVSYSYFLAALYLARCYLLCVAVLGLLALCSIRVNLLAEFFVFLPVVVAGGGILCGMNFNAMTLYFRIVAVLQIAAIFVQALFAIKKAAVKNAEKISASGNADFSKLSKREKEVAALLLQGKTNDEIAAALFVSTTTVKSHVQHIFEKYNVRNRMEFAAKVH